MEHNCGLDDIQFACVYVCPHSNRTIHYHLPGRKANPLSLSVCAGVFFGESFQILNAVVAAITTFADIVLYVYIAISVADNHDV